jgi:hypothetical protein
MSKIAALEEPLDRALALGRALELMGSGLCNIDDGLTAAVVTVAEALVCELTTAKDLWRQIAADTGRRHR